MPTCRRDSGLSLIELLVVIVLIAVVAWAASIMVRRSAAHHDAATLARTLTSARWLAVASGAPSALVARDGAVHVLSGAPLRCDLEPSGEPAWAPTGPLVLGWPSAGLAFGAHGRPLRCDGSAVGNATIALSARDGSRAAVVVASLGRVRWERR